MKTFPLIARIFIISVIFCGVATLTPAIVVYDYKKLSELTMFLVLGALAGTKNIRLIPSKTPERTGKMSIAFVVTYAAMLRLGPTGGAFVGLASGLSACVYPRQQSFYQAAFNLTNIGLTAYISGLVYVGLGGDFHKVTLMGCVVPVIALSLIHI